MSHKVAYESVLKRCVGAFVALACSLAVLQGCSLENLERGDNDVAQATIEFLCVREDGSPMANMELFCSSQAADRSSAAALAVVLATDSEGHVAFQDVIVPQNVTFYAEGGLECTVDLVEDDSEICKVLVFSAGSSKIQ